MNDGGGWSWLIIDVGFVAILGLALLYGATQYRKKRLDPLRDRKTRDLYREEDQRTADK